MRRSPPRQAKTKKRRTSGDFFKADDSEAEEPADAEEERVSQNDVVLLEVAAWKKCIPADFDTFKDDDGLLYEFKLLYSLRHQFPLHYALFKRVSSHMCHEGNAESTFSLSGGLSKEKRHTDDPSFLSTMVRKHKNKHIYTPPAEIVFKAYR